MNALSSFRPRDESVFAITRAIAAVSEETQAAERRLTALREARKRALLDPGQTAAEIAALETQARQVEISLERLALLGPELQSRLAEAEALEAQKRAERERQVADAHAACAAYLKAVGRYEASAQQIVAICELGRAADAAVGRVTGDHRFADWRPSVAKTVVLQGLDGEMLWGRLPPPPPYASPYAPVSFGNFS